MGYYNRKSHLIKTLDQMDNLYKKYNFEVIIADDKSKEEHMLDDIINNYKFKIILLKVLEKDWINPCVAYNLAITHISSETEFVVIQNPEIYHVTNILDTVLEKTKEGQYLSFPVFGTYSQDITEKFLYDTKNTMDTILKIDTLYCPNNGGRWYNHPTLRRFGLHFLNAMHINDLKKIGGFDNNYRKNIWYDDNEFLIRMKVISKLVFIPENKELNKNSPLGLHQWHPPASSWDLFKNKEEYDATKEINKKKYLKLQSDLKNNNDYNIYCDPKLDLKYDIISNNK